MDDWVHFRNKEDGLGAVSMSAWLEQTVHTLPVLKSCAFYGDSEWSQIHPEPKQFSLWSFAPLGVFPARLYMLSQGNDTKNTWCAPYSVFSQFWVVKWPKVGHIKDVLFPSLPTLLHARMCNGSLFTSAILCQSVLKIQKFQNFFVALSIVQLFLALLHWGIMKRPAQNFCLLCWTLFCLRFTQKQSALKPTICRCFRSSEGSWDTESLVQSNYTLQLFHLTLPNLQATEMRILWVQWRLFKASVSWTLKRLEKLGDSGGRGVSCEVTLHPCPWQSHLKTRNGTQHLGKYLPRWTELL